MGMSGGALAAWAGPGSPAPAGSVTLFLGGDVMTGRGIDQVLPHPSRPQLYEACVRSALDYVELAERAHGRIPRPVTFSYVWGDLLSDLERRSPDRRIVNLETSVTTSEEALPKVINYRMHPANVPCLVAAKLDCCVLANNHVLDWGIAGLRETLEVLTAAGIATAGAGRNAEDAGRPAVLDTSGKGRVLVFGFGMPSSGIPHDWAASETGPGVNLLPDSSLAHRPLPANREGPAHVRGVAGHLRVHPHDAEHVEQQWTDGRQTMAGLRRDRQGGEAHAGELPENPQLGRRVAEPVTFVRHQRGGQADAERILDGLALQRGLGGGLEWRRLGRLDECHPLLLQPPAEGLDLLDTPRVVEVHHEQPPVRLLERVSHPRLDEIGRNRRQVHELELNVPVREHPRQRELGREGVGADHGVRPGQPRVQGRLTRVRRPHQRHLGGALGPNDHRGAGARRALARTRQLFGQLLDARPDVALQVFGPLVLGDRPQHLPEAFEALPGIAGLAIGLLGVLVFGGEVRRHAFDAA